ncbi:MAG: hypothetical protein AABW58_03860 [Nanoarchaeota archaeon]
MEKTTIQLNYSTLERLKNLKKFDRESYDEVINEIINGLEEEELSDEEIQEIQEGLEDIKKGRVYSIEDVAKELRINLN